MTTPGIATTRTARQQRIVDILGRTEVRSQTQLLDLLAQDGIEVTQATLSRDLVEVGAVKVRSGRTLVYAVPGEGGDRTARPAQAAEEVSARLRRVCAELLVTADVVSLHLPLTKATRGLVDRAAIAGMKPNAILINTSRGGLVDEAALVEALKSGHLFGAGLDVFEIEPPDADHPLLKLENVVATPHISSATDVSKMNLWTTAITQALDVLAGRTPLHPVSVAPT